MRLRAQEVDRPGYVAEHLVVRDAAAFADFRHHRLIRAVTDPEIEARRHRGIAVMGEFARHLAGPFIPARHMMDHDDAGMRPGIGRMRIIRIAAVTAGAAIGRHTRLNVAKRHGGPSLFDADGSLGTEPRRKQAPLMPPPNLRGTESVGRGTANA